MAGSISSLGIGSSVLTADVIDQLKDVDVARQISPLDAKLEANKTEQNDLSALTTLVATLKTSTSTLSSELTYLGRSSSVSGDSISVSATSGADIEDFTVNVSKLALKDIYESKSFTKTTDTFASSNDTLTFTVGETDYDIDIKSTTTISELKDMINDSTDGKVQAKLMNVGGDTPYKLILQSSETGEENKIDFSKSGPELLYNLGLAFDGVESQGFAAANSAFATGDGNLKLDLGGGETFDVAVTNGMTIDALQTAIDTATSGKVQTAIVDTGASSDPYKLILKTADGSSKTIDFSGSDAGVLTDLGLNSTTINAPSHIQTGRDAEFTYEGVSITRSSNTIDDLINGATITLKEAGSSTASITQDTTSIKETIESFVSDYNALINNLNESTKYDAETGKSGTFQGNRTINNIETTINRLILSIDDKGRSLLSTSEDDENSTKYGFTLSESGLLEFNSADFDKQISKDPKDVEEFFRGSLSYNESTFQSTDVNAGALDITAGDLMINDISVTFSNNGTAAENATALKNAINDANISGVTASLDETGLQVLLSSDSGVDIIIAGDSDKLSELGLRETVVYSSYDEEEGIFAQLNSSLADMITGDEATLALFEEQLQTSATRMTEQKDKLQSQINVKYELMTTKFAAYDEQIAALNAQFQSLQNMIDAQNNSDN